MSSLRNKTLLALIPARGGSKGLPRKNVLSAAGRPLLAWTIEAARSARTVDRVIVSSDDDEIISVAAEYGCEPPFRRPATLATDNATSIDVVMHALGEIPTVDYVVLLQPTSPLRTAEDIDRAFYLMMERDAPACVSVCVADQSPYWMYKLEGGDRLVSLVPRPPEAHRRQDLPDVYVLNGAIYIAQCEWLRHHRDFVGADTVAYRMPRQRSLDIDSEEDFEEFRRVVESSTWLDSKRD
jgi:CMP-N,N'-diacetyllegionaminic acid synthase